MSFIRHNLIGLIRRCRIAWTTPKSQRVGLCVVLFLGVVVWGSIVGRLQVQGFENELSESSNVVSAVSWRLTSIMRRGRVSEACVNGRWVQAGDRFQAIEFGTSLAEVVSIDTHRVILQHERTRTVLRIRDEADLWEKFEVTP